MHFNFMKLQARYARLLVVALCAGVLGLGMLGCATTLVQSFDQSLLDQTEDFYKKGASLIDSAKAVSPRTDADRKAIVDPEKSPANVAQFTSQYSELTTSSEALILRALTKSSEIDIAGQAIQQKIDDLIQKELPSGCPDLQAEFEKVSLTVRNYVDLKCFILKMKADHSDEKLTQGTGILKKANWEGKKSILFNIILAIQKAESFKKEQ